VSAIIRACGLLARAWESENDPRNTELGVVPDIAREMSVAAQLEYDQLRAELAMATKARDEWCRQCNMASESQADAVSKLAAVTAERDAALENVGDCTVLQMHRELAETKAALEKTTAEWDRFRERIIAEANQELDALTICRTSLEASRAETAGLRSAVNILKSDVKAAQAELEQMADWCRIETEAKIDAQARIAELELRLSGEVASHDCTVADAQSAISQASCSAVQRRPCSH
jgi:chromosome segregation ATPase